MYALKKVLWRLSKICTPYIPLMWTLPSIGLGYPKLIHGACSTLESYPHAGLSNATHNVGRSNGRFKLSVFTVFCDAPTFVTCE